MRQRRDINYGKDMPPKAIWADYKRETHALIVRVLTASRLRVDSVLEEEAAPAQ